MLHRFFTLLCLLLATSGYTQDLHFSQFYHNPMHLNPAATGIFQGDLRVAALYRSQWTSVPVSYRTFSGAVDWKAIQRNTNLVALGFLLQQDKAGDAGLSWTQAGINGSVAHALGASQALSIGFGLALAQRSVDLSGLKFKNQWTGDVFDSALPTGEAFGKRSGVQPTFSAGLNWHYEPSDSRTHVDAGLGALHLNRPVISFLDDRAVRLPVRLTLTIQGALQIGETLDVVAFGLGQEMGSAREIIAGAGLRRVLSPVTAIQFSLASRIGDAIIPAFQLEYNNWTAGLSYDWNTSAFDPATSGRGGIEIALVYHTIPAPPVKTFKACPIF